MRPIAMLATLALLPGLLAAGAGAATIVVRPDGTGDYPTIRDAILAATAGDVIELTDGTFSGEWNTDFWIGTKPLTLRGQSGNAEAVILDAGSDPLVTRRCLNFQETPATFVVAHITFTGGTAPTEYGGALFLQTSASPRFEHCIFRGNLATRGGAVFLMDDCTPSFFHCLFIDNEATSYGGAVMCGMPNTSALFDHCLFVRNVAAYGGGAIAAWNSPTTPRITNCTFYGNAAPDGAALAIRWGAEPTLERTIIAYSTQGAAVWCETGCNLDVECCNLFHNAGGDWVGPLAGAEGSHGNIGLNPLFCDRGADDLRLCSASPCAAGSPPNAECDYIGARQAACECLFVCCVGGTCQFLTVSECGALAGALVTDPALQSCDPNPCPVPVEPTTWGALKARYRR
ncbi:MAG: hypothetical protein FJY75_01740 [Candidatus Eisenbacteria bacterium]|uniref:Right handed beta helix domain-containing protein n=1 Tax=Eiseniibacteriota bacterium TaxID=2212470 RepID=A0A937X9A5_UNCEI|nr:hypothetical protein [Candidatus Eisenbacteria bacterium]